MYRRLILAGVALLAVGMTTAFAQRQKQATSGDQWTVIATREIDLSKGSETFDLSASKGSVTATRVRMRTGRMVLSNVKVDYLAPATSWNERRPIELRAGGTGTNPINKGGERFLTNMTLFWAAQPGAKGVVEILAMQTDAGARASRPGASAPVVSGGGGGTAKQPPLEPGKANPASAGASAGGGAVYFGHQYVNFIRDRDVIRVASEFGQFDAIQLRVLENDITVDEMNVVYADGKSERLVVNQELRLDPKTKEARSRWLKLPGGDRFIDRVEFAYRSKPNMKGQARVEVYGELAEGWLGKNGRARKYNEGWVLLGAQTAGRFFRNETDTIPVGRNEGQFKRIRVRVKDRDLMLNELRVVYESGQEEVFKAAARVAANSTFGPINLKGERAIRAIRATYRSIVLDSKAIGRGASVVEIWGQH